VRPGLQRRDKQAVIAARQEIGNRARSKATDAIGHQPFARRGRLGIVCYFTPEVEQWHGIARHRIFHSYRNQQKLWITNLREWPLRGLYILRGLVSSKWTFTGKVSNDKTEIRAPTMKRTLVCLCIHTPLPIN